MANTCREIYNSMIEAYQNSKDKKKAAKTSLNIYEENIDSIENARAALIEIDNLVDILRASLNIISTGKPEKTQIRKGLIVSKLIPCGKHCGGCPHGPYLYKVYRNNGRLIWDYLGSSKKSQCETH